MGLKKELTVQSCTATCLTYFKIRQRVGSCCHRSLWQTAPCVFVRQQMPATQIRAIPFNSHTPPCPSPLQTRQVDSLLPPTVKSTDTIRYSSEIFQRSKASMRWPLGKKLASAPPPPPPPQSIDNDFLWGWWWWWVVPWILSEMAPHNENFCEIFVPAAELFLVTKHKFKLQQFEFIRLVISKKSLQSSRSTLFASQMFPYDRLFDLLTTSWEDSTRSGRL